MEHLFGLVRRTPSVHLGGCDRYAGAGSKVKSFQPGFQSWPDLSRCASIKRTDQSTSLDQNSWNGGHGQQPDALRQFCTSLPTVAVRASASIAFGRNSFSILAYSAYVSPWVERGSLDIQAILSGLELRSCLEHELIQNDTVLYLLKNLSIFPGLQPKKCGNALFSGQKATCSGASHLCTVGSLSGFRINEAQAVTP